MIVVVAGGAGLAGSAIVRGFENAGYKVIALNSTRLNLLNESETKEFFLVNPTGNSVRAVTPLRKPLLANGIPVTKVAEQVSRNIVCIKGKVTREVSGLNPKCPKGFKQK